MSDQGNSDRWRAFTEVEVEVLADALYADDDFESVDHADDVESDPEYGAAARRLVDGLRAERTRRGFVQGLRPGSPHAGAE